jgi:hypothetical protein
MAAPAALIDQATKRRKQFGHEVDFVQDDKPVLVAAQKQFGIGELFAVSGGFQIEVESVSACGNLKCEGSFADLAGGDYGDCGLSLKGVADGSKGCLLDPPCMLNTWRLFYKDSRLGHLAPWVIAVDVPNPTLQDKP